MPTKDLAPFSYISPQKNPLFNDKYELTTEFLSANGYKVRKRKKTAPPTNPATAPQRKFLSLLRYHLFIAVHEIRVKNNNNNI